MTSSTAILRTHEDFQSHILPDARDVTVWLPPGYERDADRTYPVLYLQDGQNLFEPAKAFKKGEHWRAGETAADLIERGCVEPLILVGIANTGSRRGYEYTPTDDRRRGGGGADDYGRLIVDELKPFIDATYRTRPGAAETAIGGSSLGGLVSLYLVLTHPEAFSRAAVMSPSVWWDRRVILRTVRDRGARLATAARPRLWVDIGTREGRSHIANTRLLKAGLLKAGWREGIDLHYEEVLGGTHSEGSWGDRFGRVLEFLFPSTFDAAER